MNNSRRYSFALSFIVVNPLTWVQLHPLIHPNGNSYSSSCVLLIRSYARHLTHHYSIFILIPVFLTHLPVSSSSSSCILFLTLHHHIHSSAFYSSLCILIHIRLSLPHPASSSAWLSLVPLHTHARAFSPSP